jgi:hypothetical protein
MTDLEELKCNFCPKCKWIGNRITSQICPQCGNTLYAGFFSNIEPQWTITLDPVYVAFLDILGFKEMVKNNNINQLFDIYKDFLLRMDNLIGNFNSLFTSNDFRKTTVNSLFVSDNVILWTEDFSQISLTKLASIVSGLINYSFLKGIPIRGSITTGEIAAGSTFRNQTIVGRGLVKSYELERIQDWAGCAISQECLDRFNSLSSEPDGKKQDFLFDLNLIVNYSVPTKSQMTKIMNAVNWLFLTGEDAISEDLILDSFYKFNKTPNGWCTKRTLQKKINNTLKFYNYINNRTIHNLK